MRILFVFFNYGSGLATHNGLALLSAIAKKEGHETKLLHFHDKLTDNDPDIYQPIVKEFNPDLIAFTSTDFEYKQVNEIAKTLKEQHPKAYFLLGGKSAIELATKNIEDTPFDIFCVGEAELPFAELLDNLSANPYGISSDLLECDGCMMQKGMWFKGKDGKIRKNMLADPITDLDSLPFPDYSIFDMDKIIESKSGWINVNFSRGCMYRCTYCFVTADVYNMFDKSKGEGRYGLDKYLRNNSVEYAISSLEDMCKKYPNIKVFNLDDELPVSIEMHKGKKYAWWLEFCKEYKRRIYDVYTVEFCANGRINLMNEEIIKAMVEAGCRECRMGFESGSFRVRKEVLDKPITNENMKQVYEWCDKHGLRTCSFTMIGIPTETEDEIWETIKMTADLKPYLIRLTFCYPFENTRLWFFCKEHNLVKEEKLYHQHGYFEESVIKLPISDEKLLSYRHLFPWYVNSILLPTNMAEKYSQMIEIFSTTDYRNPLILEKIIEIDKHLSESCSGLEHYCFFANNTAYFHCKNKRLGNEPSLSEGLQIREPVS